MTSFKKSVLFLIFTSQCIAPILAEVELLESPDASESTEEVSRGAQCLEWLQRAFNPITEDLIAKIKVEFETRSQSINYQNQVVNIIDKEDIATLVAEKLYNNIKIDLINSGTSIIGEELSTMRQVTSDFEARLQETNEKLENNDNQIGQMSSNLEELMRDKRNRVFFSAYNDNTGKYTGTLRFPKTVLNHGNAFDGTTFVAPIKGYYSFHFSGQQGRTDSCSDSVNLHIMKNGRNSLFTVVDQTEEGRGDLHNNLSYQFELELDENESIYLELASNCDYLEANWQHRLTFGGHLLLTS